MNTQSKGEVNFYVSPSEHTQQRYQVVARVCEKAMSQGLSCVIKLDDQEAAEALSLLLWSHKPESFLAHEISHEDVNNCPILVTFSRDVRAFSLRDVAIDLSSGECLSPLGFSKLVEVVVQQPQVLQATRTRYGQYQSHGIQPNTHKLSS